VVWAAAGTPTAVFPVPPGTLRTLANATVAPIAEQRTEADRLAEQAVVAAGGATERETAGENGLGSSRAPQGAGA